MTIKFWVFVSGCLITIFFADALINAVDHYFDCNRSYDTELKPIQCYQDQPTTFDIQR